MTSLGNLTKKREQQFRSLALLTVVLIYLVILAGGIVRGSGSGMGCPDWPKCFGRWIPPTDVSELPSNYQEIYSHRGYANTAFNVAKTWTEYINRLVGVLTGIFIFLTFLSSLRFFQKDPVITWLSFLAFFLVGFEGWLGAKVVSNLLAPWIVTLHMLLSLVIVGLLLYVVARTYSGVIAIKKLSNSRLINQMLILATIVLLIQILLGTQVREEVDYVADRLGNAGRAEWVNYLGTRFIIHRSFTWVVLITQGLWFWKLQKEKQTRTIRLLSNWILVLTGVQIITGIVLSYFDFPAFIQPLHLTISTISLGIQFVLILLLNRERLFSVVYSNREHSDKSVHYL